MREPDKQRYLQAARHVETGQVPFQENDPDMVIVNQLLGADFPLHWHSYPKTQPLFQDGRRRKRIFAGLNLAAHSQP